MWEAGWPLCVKIERHCVDEILSYIIFNKMSSYMAVKTVGKFSWRRRQNVHLFCENWGSIYEKSKQLYHKTACPAVRGSAGGLARRSTTVWNKWFVRYREITVFVSTLHSPLNRKQTDINGNLRTEQLSFWCECFLETLQHAAAWSLFL